MKNGEFIEPPMYKHDLYEVTVTSGLPRKYGSQYNSSNILFKKRNKGSYINYLELIDELKSQNVRNMDFLEMATANIISNNISH